LKKHAPKYSFTHASADEGHENTEQIAPQGRLPSFFQRCYLTCLHAGGLAKVIRGSTNQNPGISDTSKVPSLQIASHAHSESIQNHK